MFKKKTEYLTICVLNADRYPTVMCTVNSYATDVIDTYVTGSHRYVGFKTTAKLERIINEFIAKDLDMEIHTGIVFIR